MGMNNVHAPRQHSPSFLFFHRNLKYWMALKKQFSQLKVELLLINCMQLLVCVILIHATHVSICCLPFQWSQRHHYLFFMCNWGFKKLANANVRIFPLSRRSIQSWTNQKWLLALSAHTLATDVKFLMQNAKEFADWIFSFDSQFQWSQS